MAQYLFFLLLYFFLPFLQLKIKRVKNNVNIPRLQIFQTLKLARSIPNNKSNPIRHRKISVQIFIVTMNFADGNKGGQKNFAIRFCMNTLIEKLVEATRTSMITVRGHLSALTPIEVAIGSRCTFPCRVKYT